MTIALIGFMGCGKTTVGRLLAEKVDFVFTDMDQAIETLHKKSVATIFIDSGENSFRKMEKDFLKSYDWSLNTVLATGGGTACHMNNMDLLNKNSVTFFINVGFHELLRRLSKDIDRRPLIGKGIDLKTVYLERLLYYEQAQYIVDGNKKAEDVCQQIVEIYKGSIRSK